MRVHWRARVNLKFFATRASCTIIQEVLLNSQLVRRELQNDNVIFHVYKNSPSEFEGSWRLSRHSGMSLCWHLPAAEVVVSLLV